MSVTPEARPMTDEELEKVAAFIDECASDVHAHPELRPLYDMLCQTFDDLIGELAAKVVYPEPGP